MVTSLRTGLQNMAYLCKAIDFDTRVKESKRVEWLALKDAITCIEQGGRQVPKVIGEVVEVELEKDLFELFPYDES